MVWDQAINDFSDEQQTAPEVEPTQTAKSVRNSERTEKRSVTRSGQLPHKRISVRHSFQIYQDQLIELNRLKNQALEDGNRIFLSDLVREAIDRYLEQCQQTTE